MNSFCAVALCALLASGCSASEDTPLPALLIGTHTVSMPIEASFLPVAANGEFPVVVGGQGATMVACALRTQLPPLEGRAYTVDVALLRPDGTAWGRPRVRRNPVLASDGFYYFTDLYLLVGTSSTDDAWIGQVATLTATIKESSALPSLAEGSVTATLTDRRTDPAFQPPPPDAGGPAEPADEPIAPPPPLVDAASLLDDIGEPDAP